MQYFKHVQKLAYFSPLLMLKLNPAYKLLPQYEGINVNTKFTVSQEVNSSGQKHSIRTYVNKQQIEI